MHVLDAPSHALWFVMRNQCLSVLHSSMSAYIGVVVVECVWHVCVCVCVCACAGARARTDTLKSRVFVDVLALMLRRFHVEGHSNGANFSPE